MSRTNKNSGTWKGSGGTHTVDGGGTKGSGTRAKGNTMEKDEKAI